MIRVLIVEDQAILRAQGAPGHDTDGRMHRA